MPETLSQNNSRPVLVLDADQPSALAKLRSLARRGLMVRVASSQGQPLAGHSRRMRSCLRYRDPLPGLSDTGRIASRPWQSVAGALRQRRRLAREWQAGQPQGAGRRRLAPARHVLFLRDGNIDRRALAQAAATARYPGLPINSSAGVHAPAGRSADPQLVETAAANGINLQVWQSHTRDADMVAQADVTFARETRHLDRLLLEHPASRDKALLLGAATAAKGHDVEVPDPFGKAPAVYRQTCHQVLVALDGWLAHAPRGSTLPNQPSSSRP